MDVEHRDVIFCSTGQLLCLAGVGGSTPTVEYRSRQPLTARLCRESGLKGVLLYDEGLAYHHHGAGPERKNRPSHGNPDAGHWLTGEQQTKLAGTAIHRVSV